MLTESIAYSFESTEYVGYLAVAEGVSGKPGVLICHEGNGLGPQVKDRAHRLAELGYVAFALDFVGGGQVLPDMASMMAKLGALRGNPAHARRLAQAGLDVLRARPEVDVNRIAATGYCYGGTLALELARAGAPLVAVCGFHSGLGTATPEDAASIRGKILVCIGADDPLIPPAERAAFEAEMRAAKVDWRLLLIGGAVHGFANPLANAMNNPAVRYDELADRRTWRAMRDLFDETF